MDFIVLASLEAMLISAAPAIFVGSATIVALYFTLKYGDSIYFWLRVDSRLSRIMGLVTQEERIELRALRELDKMHFLLEAELTSVKKESTRLPIADKKEKLSDAEKAFRKSRILKFGALINNIENALNFYRELRDARVRAGYYHRLAKILEQVQTMKIADGITVDGTSANDRMEALFADLNEARLEHQLIDEEAERIANRSMPGAIQENTSEDESEEELTENPASSTESTPSMQRKPIEEIDSDDIDEEDEEPPKRVPVLA